KGTGAGSREQSVPSMKATFCAMAPRSAYRSYERSSRSPYGRDLRVHFNPISSHYAAKWARNGNQNASSAVIATTKAPFQRHPTVMGDTFNSRPATSMAAVIGAD